MKIEAYQSKEKQAQMLKLLQFGTVMVFVDSRHQDVIVPGYLKGDYQLRLNFDYGYEIADFRVLPDRIEASLSFNKKNFFCAIPFTAIYLMINNNIEHGALFIESVPIEMLQYFAIEAEEAKKEANKREGSHLSVISTDTGESKPNPSKNKKKTSKKTTNKDSSKKEKTPRKKGHLRLVK